MQFITAYLTFLYRYVLVPAFFHNFQAHISFKHVEKLKYTSLSNNQDSQI